MGTNANSHEVNARSSDPGMAATGRQFTGGIKNEQYLDVGTVFLARSCHCIAFKNISVETIYAHLATD